LTPSLDPLSPEATVTVMPRRAASCATWSKFTMDCELHVDSAPPQLMEITLGWRNWS
jgi:hypothetical protein